jgi:hypothetical protein
MPTVVSTSEPKPLKVAINVTGLPMTELEATKFAASVRDSLCYQLGRKSDDDSFEVEVTAEAMTATDDTDNPNDKPEDQDEGDKPDAKAIAAMDPAEYRAAKTAGRI